MNEFLFNVRRVVLLLGVCVVCVCAACASSRAPETGAPRDATAVVTPITLEFPADQATQTRQAFAALLRAQGIADSVTQPTLTPITNTIAALPALIGNVRLPRVSPDDESVTDAEAEREALRRFVITNATLLGIDPTRVSLVEIVTQPDGQRRAVYEQKPFLFPLSGGYGILRITFMTNGTVTQLSSTALPQAAQVAPQIVLAARNLITADQARERFAALTSRPSASLTPRGIVVLPVPRLGTTNVAALELRLAWAIETGGQIFYLDARSGNEVIDTSDDTSIIS
ncbi:MAG: hypothetical protein MSG64_11665 [Pyrinomonadaceae bacterium MAG19_C2-C3]|nr:hypothetical protein [Pyrinomonadaceae bacterium MAG19_C2-C3]